MGILFNKFIIPYFNEHVLGKTINDKPRNQVQFGTIVQPDTFECTNPQKYTSEIVIRKLASGNPKIRQILAEAKLTPELNIEGLNRVLTTHATSTQKVAEGIYENLPAGLKMKADINSIKEAAYLHDIGKVFIPDEILNKNGKLDDSETKIMHKHSELGYELLKNTNLNPKTLTLIRNHHQNAQKSGYPNVGKDFCADLDLQILSMADKFSALSESRSYKPAMNREQALTIIRKDVLDKKLNPLVFTALVSYTNSMPTEIIHATT